MALLRGKFIDANEVIKQNQDPIADEDLARKSYVDTSVAELHEATSENISSTLVKRDGAGGFDMAQLYLYSPNQPRPNVYGYVDYTEMGLYDDESQSFSILTFAGLNLAQSGQSRSNVGLGEIQLFDGDGEAAIPTADQQVTTKKYVDQQIGATLKVPHKENFVLTNTDISNGYVDLTRLIVDESSVVNLGGIEQHEGDDYTVSTVGGITRVTFIGPLLPALVPGDKVYIRYWSLT